MESLNDFLKPEIIWFLIGVALLLMEFGIPGLVIFFFGVGACITAAACLIIEDLSINSKLLTFIGASVLSLACLRKWLKGIFIGQVSGKKGISESTSEFVGQKATVITAIDPKLGGKIELHGTNWKAESDEAIAKGVAVEITGKNNLTMKVKAI